jgi:hypothetical protein
MVQFLLASIVAAAPLPPVQAADRLEPIGWSSDQHTVALRVFYGGTFSEAVSCTGYVDAAGKRFETGLAIVVLRDGAVLHSFVIQAPPASGPCTAPEAAKKALEAAKKKLDELGIDRSAPGTVLAVTMEQTKPTAKKKDDSVVSTWTETWRARNGEQTPLELVATMNDTVTDELFHAVKASFSWKRRSGDSARTGTLKLGPVEWSLNQAGTFAWKLDAFASPNGASIVAFIRQSFGHMRGDSSVTTLLPLDAKK